MAKKRNYREEYDEYHSTAEQRRNRSNRNKARRKKGLAVGDPREVDHVLSIKKGGGNSSTNLRITSRKKNRKKGAS